MNIRLCVGLIGHTPVLFQLDVDFLGSKLAVSCHRLQVGFQVLKLHLQLLLEQQVHRCVFCCVAISCCHKDKVEYCCSWWTAACAAGLRLTGGSVEKHDTRSPRGGGRTNGALLSLPCAPSSTKRIWLVVGRKNNKVTPDTERRASIQRRFVPSNFTAGTIFRGTGAHPPAFLTPPHW